MNPLNMKKKQSAKTKPAGGPLTRFLQHHYRHFNAAALVDAAQGYVAHLGAGGKMMITLGGAMSAAELGLSLAEMIRRDKVHLITCTAPIWKRTYLIWSPTIITSACRITAA